MTRVEAGRALKKANDFHSGKVKLPPEIVELKKLIQEKTNNAVLFTARLRVVDEGMIHEIVQLKRRLDGLYAEWSSS